MYDLSILSIISVILSLYIISFIILLIMENRDPNKTLAWILIVTFLPFFGLLLYFYLGQNWKKKQLMKHFQTKTLNKFLEKKAYYSKKVLSNAAKVEIKSELEKKLINSIIRMNRFGLTTRNNMTIYDNGLKKFTKLIKEIKSAKKYIHMEYYQVIDDNYSRILRDVLIEKALQGVEVRVLFDFQGSFKFLYKYRLIMRRAGVDIHSFFNPLRLFQYHKLNYRNHRKITIIDGKKAFIGGMNIGEMYINGSKRFDSWKDLHFLFEGEVVHQLQTIFLYDWYLTTKKSIIKEKYYPPISKKSLKHKVIQTVFSGPECYWEAIKHVFFLMITNANHSINITTPYFIPTESMITSLKNAAIAGVDIKIVLPRVADYHIPFHASRTYFEELMEAGVKFYEYQPGFIHAKSVIVDSITATVGTTNFDIRGFQVNFESNVVLYNKKDVIKIENIFNKIINDSILIEPTKFKKRPITQKFKQSLARLLSPVL
jgi:cardiolipin synthase A/B